MSRKSLLLLYLPERLNPFFKDKVLLMTNGFVIFENFTTLTTKVDKNIIIFFGVPSIIGLFKTAYRVRPIKETSIKNEIQKAIRYLASLFIITVIFLAFYPTKNYL